VLVMAIVVAVAGSACTTDAEFECPVTIPFTPAFVPPEPFPPQPSTDGMVWFGTADLWTSLPTDGAYEIRKSVWWSQHYTDPGVDPFPEIDVVWHRLDVEAEDISNGGLGTNGSTADRTFIIAGIDPNRSGCWKVTATFGEASLAYVYQHGTG